MPSEEDHSLSRRWKWVHPSLSPRRLTQRDYRKGWPLLTVETEVNGESKSTNERVLPRLVRWACRAGTRNFCPALAALHCKSGSFEKYLNQLYSTDQIAMVWFSENHH